jgi:hypothetical protein
MGYVDRTGKVAIQPQFIHAYEFRQGLAFVWLDDGVGWIDRTGNLVWYGEFRPGIL